MLPLAKSTRFSVNNLQLCLHFQQLTTTAFGGAGDGVGAILPSVSNHATPINEAHLLRICTVLYQQQNASDDKLNAKLTKTQFDLTHEFFLQVCNKFPYSWRPIYRFHQFSLSQLNFSHTSTTFNKMLDIVGKSKNIDLLWDLCEEMGKLQLVNIKTYIIVVGTLAAARELKKCIQFFHMMNNFGYVYNLETFNEVIQMLCRRKLVAEANHIVLKLRDWIEPDGETYRWLIHGFCDVGDLVEASKVWNLIVEEGFKPDIAAVEIILERFFKNDKFREGLKLFQSISANRPKDLRLSTYRLVINWLCKKDRIGEAHFVFKDMQTRGMQPDNEIFGSILYALMTRGRVKEAYKVFQRVDSPDISVYHGMIKGLLRLKKADEATDVFREMIRRGCEPTMHTYVMLLQGHLGKRGRKGEDPLVNFDTIFLGGLVKAGKSYEMTKYVERVINRGVEVPRFDYNKFLHYFSNEEGVLMFEVMAGKLREVGLFDLADIFERYGLIMATRNRRRNGAVERRSFCGQHDDVKLI